MSNSFDIEPNTIPANKEQFIKNGNRYLDLYQSLRINTDEGKNITTKKIPDDIIPRDQ